MDKSECQWSHKLPRSKKALEISPMGEKRIELDVLPAVMLSGEVSGYRFIGRTEEDALINAKAFLIPFYKQKGYWPVEVTIKDE